MLSDVSLPSKSLWANVWSTLWMACTVPVGKSYTVWHFTAETVNGRVKEGLTNRKESLTAQHLFVTSEELFSPDAPEWEVSLTLHINCICHLVSAQIKQHEVILYVLYHRLSCVIVVAKSLHFYKNFMWIALQQSLHEDKVKEAHGPYCGMTWNSWAGVGGGVLSSMAGVTRNICWVPPKPECAC